jgi:hypothetical protein
MLIKRLSRSVFYSNKRKPKTSYFDCRDAYEYYVSQEKNEEIRFVARSWLHNLKLQVATWAIIGSSFIYFFYKSKRLREKFEINYINQLPVKDYEPSDYDYKYWELVAIDPKNEKPQILNTDKACLNNYVLLYHAETKSSHIAMQRFARLKKYISLRKELPIESVFVGMDKDTDPELLYEYARQYAKDLIICYPNNEEVRQGLISVFQNVGCIYLLEIKTGNVIYIIDPNKHSLETIGSRLIYNISKNESFRISRVVIDRKVDIKEGHEEDLRPKLPTY